MRIAIAALGLGAALCACETPAPQYGPAQGPGAYGYSETQIESDRFRVSYRSAGPATRASDLALLRAADLTLSRGNDWFVVTQRTFEGGDYRSGPRVSFGVGGASFGSHSAVGLGVGTGFGGGDRAGGVVATLKIRMGRGPKPADPNAYDAHDVQRSIRPAG